MEESQEITVDGKPYDVASLTDEQKYVIKQLIDLDEQIRGVRFKLDQLEASRSVFGTKLKEILS